MSARPEVLFPLFAPLESLTGIGAKTARHFQGLGVETPRDLLFTLPSGVVDRRVRETIEGIVAPQIVTVAVTIGAHRPASRKGGAYRISVTDAKAHFELVFFHARGDFWQRTLPEGCRRIVSGRVETFDGRPQMVHPDHILPEEDAGTLPAFEPIYPLTAGVTQKLMFKATTSALLRIPHLHEWMDRALCQSREWPDFATAMQQAHRPSALAAGQDTAPARRRLAYDELFAHQITLALARARIRRGAGLSNIGDGALQRKVLGSLPFRPTGAQERAIAEINADMAAPTRMNRLLQGDVGAGKTLVAMMALLRAVEAGGQGVLMAPTEILAQQHLEALRPLAQAAGVRIEVLTGRYKGAVRRQKLSDLAEGRIDLLLGTHAVFQEDVDFHDLRLAVIDEQHRFGVRQRLALGRKGAAVDTLVMTATPIPRTLSLSQYGDLDISVLDEKPPGRKPVQTVVISDDRLDEVIDRLQAAVDAGRQAYWVCPLVEESESVALAAAQSRFEKLRARLGAPDVGLVHGQMPSEDKDQAMARFQQGETKVLVATTVIEVGVNVPNATIMVIERAETFGLAQLHQLRGRVGRGDAQSTCLLMYQSPLSNTARQRLDILRRSEDGFEIAETDLQMRGAGNVVGTTQSGLPKFRIADLERHGDLMAIAQKDARAFLSSDPNLESDRGQAVRVLLWLMRQEEAIRLISVG